MEDDENYNKRGYRYIGEITDLNDVLTLNGGQTIAIARFYGNSSIQNAPDSEHGGVSISIHWDANQMVQIATSNNTTNLYIRYYIFSGFSKWYKFNIT